MLVMSLTGLRFVCGKAAALCNLLSLFYFKLILYGIFPRKYNILTVFNRLYILYFQYLDMITLTHTSCINEMVIYTRSVLLTELHSCIFPN